MSVESLGYEMEEVAKNYVKYRPDYPPQLSDRIIKYLVDGSEGSLAAKRDLALDVGCGAGQSTKILAGHFAKVIGIDMSEAQLSEARNSSINVSNIEFKFSTAEDLSSIIEVESVDLVTVGIALHFFEVEKFFMECLRVLKPGGVLAAYMYIPCLVEPDGNKLFQTVLRNMLESYGQPYVQHWLDKYHQLFTRLSHLFSHCVRDETVSWKSTKNMKQLAGFFQSLPQFMYYKRDNPQRPDDFDVLFEKVAADNLGDTGRSSSPPPQFRNQPQRLTSRLVTNSMTAERMEYFATSAFTIQRN